MNMTTNTPSGRELVLRATEMVPLLRRGAIAGERLRRLPDENVAALDAAGMLRMARLQKWGGYMSDPLSLAAAITAIASGCPATAWVLMIYNTAAQLAEALPDAALAEVYASANSRMAAVFNRSGAQLEKVEGGYRVRGTGNWSFNSGCHHAGWDLLRVNIVDANGKLTEALACIPISDLEIGDDWHVMGAIGTGSVTVSCGAIFIPEHRVAPMTVPMQALLRPELHMAQGVALPLGMMRSALEAFIELAKAQGLSRLGYNRMLDSPAVQTAIGNATGKIKLVEAFQHYTLTASDPGGPGVLAITIAACYRLARDLIQSLYELCPSSEAQTDQRMQRLLRDINVFDHQHAFVQSTMFELYGRGVANS